MRSLSFQPSMWQNRNYVRLLSAQIISLIGTGVSSVCLALLAYDLAGEEASMVLSIAFALKMIAYIGLAPILGAFAHRLPKRQTLAALDWMRALMFLCLPFVDQVWEVYVLMFMINACSAGFTPLYQSTLPQVLSNKEHYTKALSLSRLAYDLELILSPIIAAILLSMLGFRELFMIDSATFVLSGILIIFCSLPHKAARHDDNNRRGIATLSQGITQYLQKTKLRALWFAYLGAACASAMVLVNTVVYVHDVLAGNETETILAMLLVGMGSIFVAICLPRWLQRHTPERYHVRGLGIICLSLFAGYFTPGWVGFALMCIAMGIGISCIQTSAGIIINAESEGEDSSPYFAAHFSLTHFWWLITYLTAGFSANFAGLANAYLVMLGLACMSVLLYVLNDKG
ncbi:MFS transporter [Photobacterium profundum]|nr:MFS transporter [Photobacterium profundum]